MLFPNMRLILFLFLLALPLWLPSTYRRSTHAFRPSKCLIDWPHKPEWETPPLADPNILKQPFKYLSKGGQSYVFASEDGKYVLKLFRYDQCRMPFGRLCAAQIRKWTGHKPRHFIPAQIKIENTFKACSLAFRYAREQTGLVYIHLNPKEGLPKLTLIDRLGRKHLLDPSKIRFALQRRAAPFLPSLAANPNLLSSFQTLLSELSSAGIVNTDPRLRGNFGVLDGKVIALDFGYFAYSPDEAKQNERHFEDKLQRWIAKHSQ